MLVDISVIFILVLFFLIGYKKGVIAEFISFSALLFNIVLTKEMTPIIIGNLEFSTTNKLYNIFIYVIIFAVTYFIFATIIGFLLRTISGKKRFFIDSLIGAILGLAKGFLIVIILFLVLLVVSKFDVKVEKEVKTSRLFEISNRFTEITIVFLPTDIKDLIEKYNYEKEIEKAIKDTLGGRK